MQTQPQTLEYAHTQHSHGNGRLKLQYFIVFAVNGCLWPFIPVYFQQKHLNETQIGNAMALGSLAVVLSPVLVTLLADARLEARKVLALVLGLTALSLLFLPIYSGYLAILCAWLAVNLVQVPTSPLQDGINFAIQQQRKTRGLSETPYHKIRVWGTIGFLSPGLLLYLLVQKSGGSVTVVLYMAAAFAVAGAVNALLLPPLASEQKVLDRKPPTLEAARVLFGKQMIVFCMAMFLVQMAAACYYSFYPVYLNKGLGIDSKWIGMIMNLGVVLEILFMLGFGRIYQFLGPRRFILVACASMGLRMALLAAIAHPAVAIATQAFHGMMVLLLTVAPTVLVNSVAQDQFRHSIQGLYTMLMLGGGRIVGNLLAGPIARQSYQRAYWWATGLITVAILFLWVGYHPAEERTEK